MNIVNHQVIARTASNSANQTKGSPGNEDANTEKDLEQKSSDSFVGSRIEHTIFEGLVGACPMIGMMQNTMGSSGPKTSQSLGILGAGANFAGAFLVGMSVAATPALFIGLGLLLVSGGTSAYNSHHADRSDGPGLSEWLG